MNVKINIIEDSKIRKASAKKAINKKSLTGCVNCGNFGTGPPLPGMFIIFTHFQGILTSETRCLNCETVTSKDEEFCDLSIDVDQVGYQVSF